MAVAGVLWQQSLGMCVCVCEEGNDQMFCFQCGPSLEVAILTQTFTSMQHMLPVCPLWSSTWPQRLAQTSGGVLETLKGPSPRGKISVLSHLWHIM